MTLYSFSRQVYNTVFRRTSTFVLAVVIVAYPFERAFNVATENFYRSLNRGKLYDDIKDSFKKEEEEEEE
uniref:Complex III subunit 9 n=1 Tax=Arion vulgaris TaxID=1028688 RepID=A0A0B7BMD4_9EUPU